MPPFRHLTQSKLVTPSFNVPDVIASGGGAGAAGIGQNGGSGGSGGGAQGELNAAGSGGASSAGTAYGNNAIVEGYSGGASDPMVGTFCPNGSASGGGVNGGGGGGAGGPGSDVAGYFDGYNSSGCRIYASSGGNGGNGLYFALTGNAAFDTWYAGGGGGHDSAPGDKGVEGSNGLGGGGGPSFTGGGAHGSFSGYAGGNGIVILRYRFQ